MLGCADAFTAIKVTMTCGGCSGAVERVLKKLDGLRPRIQSWCAYADSFLGVKQYSVNLQDQTADIVAEDRLDYQTTLSTIKKTGKKVNSGEADGVPQSV